jgi:hypothetical protein
MSTESVAQISAEADNDADGDGAPRSAHSGLNSCFCMYSQNFLHAVHSYITLLIVLNVGRARV